jgi:3-hydroxyisobutyrate dehydrogenase-like beta-hydroxyacid dehydrogenase
MNVTIIGAGNMGKGLTKQLARAGHQVTVTPRDLGKAQALAKEFANVTAALAIRHWDLPMSSLPRPLMRMWYRH